MDEKDKLNLRDCSYCYVTKCCILYLLIKKHCIGAVYVTRICTTSPPLMRKNFLTEYEFYKQPFKQSKIGARFLFARGARNLNPPLHTCVTILIPLL